MDNMTIARITILFLCLGSFLTTLFSIGYGYNTAFALQYNLPVLSWKEVCSFLLILITIKVFLFQPENIKAPEILGLIGVKFLFPIFSGLCIWLLY